MRFNVAASRPTKQSLGHVFPPPSSAAAAAIVEGTDSYSATVTTRSTARHLAVSLPSLMVVLPLIGFSFQLDQRSEIYRSAVEGFGHPLEAARDAYSGIDEYLSRGNFRPIGRFLENFSHGFVFEAAEATGMAPHVVHGLVRIAMIGLLALTATQMVAAVMRSARTAPHRPPGLRPLSPDPGSDSRSRRRRRPPHHLPVYPHRHLRVHPCRRAGSGP